MTSRTPWIVLAAAIAACSSAADFTVPDSVTTPRNVFTSSRNPPTRASFNRAIFTRVVVVASSFDLLLRAAQPVRSKTRIKTSA